MYWIWIPAVVLLAIFSIALCWYFFSDYTCCPCRRRRPHASLLPTTCSVQLRAATAPPSVPAAPSAPPAQPQLHESPIVRLTLGSKKLSDIIFEENGVPNLDLHGMTVLEARSATQGFIQRQRILGSSPIQIITGKGIHSTDGVARIKPVVQNILLGEDLKFVESSQGGAYLVYL